MPIQRKYGDVAALPASDYIPTMCEEPTEELVCEVARMLHDWEGQEYRVDGKVELPSEFARRLIRYIGENLARNSSPSSSE